MMVKVIPAVIDNTALNPMAFPSKDENRKPNCNNFHKNS